MITPTAEEVEERKAGVQRRIPFVALAVVLMISSIFTPHIGIRVATEFGRSLFPESAFFLAAEAGGSGFGPVANVTALAWGLDVGYVGLSFQHLGLLLCMPFCWIVAAADVGRWFRRFALVGGCCLILSAPTIVFAYQLIQSSGVAAYLGVAWLFSLAAGVIMVVGAQAARARLDSTWYWSKPDLNG